MTNKEVDIRVKNLINIGKQLNKNAYHETQKKRKGDKLNIQKLLP